MSRRRGSLAAEYVARNPRRYGGLTVLSGGLLGPEAAGDYDGDLDGTPVFLGCSDVTDRLYPDLGHAINDDEIRVVDSLVADLV
jgi:phospholipase/carboxylesterase